MRRPRPSASRWPAALLLGLAVLSAAGSASAQRDAIPSDYPHSLMRDLAALLAALDRDPSDVNLLTRLADLYLNIADDLYTDAQDRLAAYEEGARTAERAIELREANADAHFLYAAALGSAARLKGPASAALVLRNVKRHVAGAIELRPDHAPALQMMGGLLAELPRFLGGDPEAAERYLMRAIAADGDYTNARILLAKLYLKQGRVDAARLQLRAVVGAAHPHYPYAWARRFKPEAERLLKSLDEPQ